MSYQVVLFEDFSFDWNLTRLFSWAPPTHFPFFLLIQIQIHFPFPSLCQQLVHCPVKATLTSLLHCWLRLRFILGWLLLILLALRLLPWRRHRHSPRLPEEHFLESSPTLLLLPQLERWLLLFLAACCKARNGSSLDDLFILWEFNLGCHSKLVFR